MRNGEREREREEKEQKEGRQRRKREKRWERCLKNRLLKSELIQEIILCWDRKGQKTIPNGAFRKLENLTEIGLGVGDKFYVFLCICCVDTGVSAC